MAKYQEKIDISFTYDKTGVKNIQNQLRQIQKLADKPLQIGSIKDLQQVSVQMDKQGQKMKEVIRVTDEFGNKWNVNMQKAKGGTDMLVNSVKLSSTASKDHAAALNKTKVAIQDAQRKAKEYMAVINEHATSTGMKEEAKKLQQELNKLGVSSDMTTQDLKEMGANAKKTSKDLGSISRQASIAGKGTLKLGHMIRTAAKAFTVWISVTAAFFRTIQEIKRGIEMITNLDTALVELRKVSDLTVEGFDEFIGRAQKVAQTVARTSAEVTQATADFARMGYTVRESLDLAEQALILVNVGDGIENVDQATQSIISTLKGFQMEATEASHIVDGLNEVANNFAVTTSDLADGVQRAGSTLAQSGTTYEETLGLLTATNEVLQKMEKSSTGLITISQRIRGVSEAFEDGEAPVNFTAKLGEAYRRIAGVNIMVDGQLRSTYDILNDMSNVWDDLTAEQQQYIGELSAGKRRVNVFNALMSNTKTITEATAAATDSFGSALEENEKYLDSIEGKTRKFTEAVERLWTNAINTDTIKNIVDFGTAIINLTDEFGLLNTVLMALITTLVIFKKQMVATFLWGLVQNFAYAITMLGHAFKSSAVSAALFSGVLSTLLPLLALAGIMYGIKKLREMNQWLDDTKESADNLYDALKQFEDDPTDFSGLVEAIEDIDISEVNEQIDRYNQLIRQAQTQGRSQAYIDSLKEELSVWENLSDKYYNAKEALSLYTRGVNEQKKASEELLEELNRISDAVEEQYNKVKEGTHEQKLLNAALEEMSENGNLSQETYEALIEVNSDYIEILGLESEELIKLLNNNRIKSQESIRLARSEAESTIALARLKIEAYESEMSQMERYLQVQKRIAVDEEEKSQIQEALNYMHSTDYNQAIKDLETAEAKINTIDHALKMFAETGDDASDSTSATAQELEKFYDQLRAISEAKYLLDMAETSEEQKIAIEKLVLALKNYNSELKTEISRLDSLVDVTDGISSAEVEHINARDELIDVLRSNNVEIKNLQSSYEELQKVEKKSVEELQSIIKEVESQFVEMIRKREELQREANEEWFKEEKESYKKAHEDKMKFYDNELDAFKNMIDEKKQALKDQFDEEDYQEELAGLRREEADIQSQINILKLRDDVEAKAKTIELEKDLAEKRTEISDLQREHERDALLDNLDKQLDEQEEYYDDIKSNEERIYEFKMERLEKEYEENVARLDRMYTKEKVYAEARKMLLKGNIQEIKEAYQSFENEFGEGLSYLGDTVIENFIKKLKEARDAIKSLEGAKMPSAGTSGGRGGSSTGGATETDIMTSGGIKTKGYIIGGKTYYDPEGKSRVDPGTYVDTAAGTYVLKDDGTGEKVSDSKIIGSYETGTTSVPKDGLAYIHEGEAIIPKNFNPFNINNNSSFVSNVKDGLLSSLTGKMGSSSYDIDINVAGNLDRDSIPNLKSAIKDVINEKDREKYRRNKKIGVYNY